MSRRMVHELYDIIRMNMSILPMTPDLALDQVDFICVWYGEPHAC